MFKALFGEEVNTTILNSLQKKFIQIQPTFPGFLGKEKPAYEKQAVSNFICIVNTDPVVFFCSSTCEGYPNYRFDPDLYEV